MRKSAKAGLRGGPASVGRGFVSASHCLHRLTRELSGNPITISVNYFRLSRLVGKVEGRESIEQAEKNGTKGSRWEEFPRSFSVCSVLFQLFRVSLKLFCRGSSRVGWRYG